MKLSVEKEIQREWKALCCVEIIIEHLTGKQAYWTCKIKNKEKILIF